MNDPFEHVPIAILQGRTDGAFAHGNRAWRTFAGDVSLEDAVHPDDRDRVQLSIRTGMLVGGEFSLEARLRGVTSAVRRHSLRFASNGEAGTSATQTGADRSDGPEWLAVATDIDAIASGAPPSSVSRPVTTANETTDVEPTAKSAPAPSELEASIVDFRQQMAGIIGHDLRNPLNTLVMGSTLLRAKVQTDGERKLVTRLINASARMNRMISQLVDFAAVRLGGELEMAREPMDFVAVLRETVEEIETSRGISVAIEAPETVPGFWDPRRLEQVVFNLVTNAAVHGAAPISIVAITTDRRVTLEVRDAGPMLSRDLLAQLFLPIRKRISVSREAGSLGLGLYITEQIVQAHGGRIEARSTTDGTVFRVELPRPPRSE